MIPSCDDDDDDKMTERAVAAYTDGWDAVWSNPNVVCVSPRLVYIQTHLTKRQTYGNSVKY